MSSPRILAALFVAPAMLVAACAGRPPTPVLTGAPAAVGAPAASPADSSRHILLRGRTGPYTGHPLVIVDGVVYPTAPDSAGGAPSLPDLRPEEIDAIEVLKGEEALVRFGPAARDGVVLVRTKNGSGAAASGRP